MLSMWKTDKAVRNMRQRAEMLHAGVTVTFKLYPPDTLEKEYLSRMLDGVRFAQKTIRNADHSIRQMEESQMQAYEIHSFMAYLRAPTAMLAPANRWRKIINEAVALTDDAYTLVYQALKQAK